MKHTSILYVLSIFCLTVPVSQAEDIRYYDVEVVIFEHLKSSGRDSENWPNSIVQEAPEKNIAPGKPYPGRLPEGFKPAWTFKQLPRKAWQLTDKEKELQKSDKYRVLLHTAWRQPGISQDEAVSVHLQKRFRISLPQTEPAATETTSLADAQPQAMPEQSAEASVNAFITVTLSRYLHLDADVLYQIQPQNSTDFLTTHLLESEQTPASFYRLQQRRRMRSKELHYFDNPTLGILALITPFKPAKAPAKRGKAAK